MICAGCLNQRIVKSETKERRSFRFPVAAIMQWTMALLVVWVLFYLVAQTLSDIPDEFHDGTIWE